MFQFLFNICDVLVYIFDIFDIIYILLFDTSYFQNKKSVSVIDSCYFDADYYKLRKGKC